jgi:hypothetical protein
MVFLLFLWTELKGAFPLSSFASWGMLHGARVPFKEVRIQVLASLGPPSQTVGSNIRVMHEQAKHSS